MVVYNSYSTASLTNGQPCEWDLGDANGYSVTKPTATAVGAGFTAAGIVAETIAAGGYGLIQVYGYHSATRVRAASTSGAAPVGKRPVTAGVPLRLSSQESTAGAVGVFCLEGQSTGAATILSYPCAFALGSNAEWTTAAMAVFVKCL